MDAEVIGFPRERAHRPRGPLLPLPAGLHRRSLLVRQDRTAEPALATEDFSGLADVRRAGTGRPGKGLVAGRLDGVVKLGHGVEPGRLNWRLNWRPRCGPLRRFA